MEQWNFIFSLFVSRFIEFRGRRIRYYDGIIEFRILPLKNIFRAMIINTQWKYRKNILFVWTNSKRISDTLLELIKIYQILVFHILSSRNRRRSRIKRISYIYIYIEESRSNSSDSCQASLKREARESRPPFISGGARGRGTKRERGEERDTGPECLFSNEDGTGRFGLGSIRWTQHWKILDTWVLILRPRSAQRNSRYSLFNPSSSLFSFKKGSKWDVIYSQVVVY